MHQYLQEYIKDRRFRKTMAGIASPIILQMLLTNGLSFVDTMMIGHLGASEIAAVGLANQMFFLAFLVFFGITSGTGIFVAQFWGNHDLKGIHHVVGLSLAGSIFFAIPFALVSRLFPYELMRLFTPDPVVIRLGAEYLRIIAPSYIFSGISFSFAMALRSIEHPRIPLVATAVSLGINSFLNLLLIFGLFGFPALGVRGAGMATMISRSIELTVILTLVYSGRLPVAAGIREYLGFDRSMVKEFVITAGPVLMNEIAWSLGMVVYKIVFARMGTDVIAAANITESILGLFFVVLMGTSTTAAIMIGKKIGGGKREEADLFARYFLLQGVFLGIILGILMSASAPFIVMILRMDQATISLVRITLIAIGFLIPFKAFNLHMIVGILRSGGDTSFSFIVELIGVWFIGVPAALLAGLHFHLSLPVVYLLVGMEEIFKLILTARRFRSGKWMNNLTRKQYR